MPGVVASKSHPRSTAVQVTTERLVYEDVDEVLAPYLDDQGQLIDQATTAGDAAVQRFRRGEDPAATVDPADA